FDKFIIYLFYFARLLLRLRVNRPAAPATTAINPPSNQLNVDVAVLGNVLSSSESTTTVPSSNSSASPSTTIVGSSSSTPAPAGVSSIKTPYVEKWLTFVEIVLRSPSTDPPCSSHLSSFK